MGKQKPSPANYVGRSSIEKWRAAGVEAVTVEEVAQALGVTRTTVRALPLAYTSVNERGDRRYLVDEVERYLVANTRNAG